MILAERNRQVAALAIATLLPSASGRSANRSAISACVRKYCSAVKRRGRRLSDSVWPSAMQTRASCARKSSGVRNWIGCVATMGTPAASRERDGRLHQRFVVGMAGALHFEHVALRKPRGPFAGEPFRRGGVALQQRLSDIAVARAGQRDQAFGAFIEPRPIELRAAAMLMRQVRARQPAAKPQVTVARWTRAARRAWAARGRARWRSRRRNRRSA